MFPIYISAATPLPILTQTILHQDTTVGQKLFFCQYFEKDYLLLGQFEAPMSLGGNNIYAIYDQFLMVMPNQL